MGTAGSRESWGSELFSIDALTRQSTNVSGAFCESLRCASNKGRARAKSMYRPSLIESRIVDHKEGLDFTTSCQCRQTSRQGHGASALHSARLSMPWGVDQSFFSVSVG